MENSTFPILHSVIEQYVYFMKNNVFIQLIASNTD